MKEETMEKKREKCEHDWKQLGTKQGETFLELVCVKCGKKKDLDLFP